MMDELSGVGDSCSDRDQSLEHPANAKTSEAGESIIDEMSQSDSASLAESASDSEEEEDTENDTDRPNIETEDDSAKKHARYPNNIHDKYEMSNYSETRSKDVQMNNDTPKFQERLEDFDCSDSNIDTILELHKEEQQQTISNSASETLMKNNDASSEYDTVRKDGAEGNYGYHLERNDTRPLVQDLKQSEPIATSLSESLFSENSESTHDSEIFGIMKRIKDDVDDDDDNNTNGVSDPTVNIESDKKAYNDNKQQIGKDSLETQHNTSMDIVNKNGSSLSHDNSNPQLFTQDSPKSSIGTIDEECEATSPKKHESPTHDSLGCKDTNIDLNLSPKSSDIANGEDCVESQIENKEDCPKHSKSADDASRNEEDCATKENALLNDTISMKSNDNQIQIFSSQKTTSTEKREVTGLDKIISRLSDNRNAKVKKKKVPTATLR